MLRPFLFFFVCDKKTVQQDIIITIYSNIRTFHSANLSDDYGGNNRLSLFVLPSVRAFFFLKMWQSNVQEGKIKGKKKDNEMIIIKI